MAIRRAAYYYIRHPMELATLTGKPVRRRARWNNRDQQPVLRNDTKMVFLGVQKNEVMKRTTPKNAGTEMDCPACGGTGFPPVAEPARPGHRIFPAPCEKCHGKGRIEIPRRGA
jgi:DnaJ-class molecular chaperone